MDFSHDKQIQYIDELKKIASGILDRNCLTDIQKSIADSKSHAVIGGNQIHITLPLRRYRSYMDFVVTSEQNFVDPKQLVKDYAAFVGVNITELLL